MNSTSLLVSCKLIKTFEGFSFASIFKKLVFARLFSLNFLSRSPWCSTILLEFESYNLQHCKKNCCKLVFWVFTEQLNYQLLAHTLLTKIFDKKSFIKDLLKVNQKSNSGVLGINQIMSKLPTLRKRFQLTCQEIIAVVCIVTLYFKHAENSLTFYVLHITDRVVEKEGRGERCPPLFPGAKLFFHVKLENITFLHVNNM